MKQKRCGFTIAELLIVVAIIAVLIGIAIPVFTAHLEKSMEITDIANVRSMYVEVLAAAIEDDANAKHNGDPLRQDNDVYLAVLSPITQKTKGWTMDISHVTIGQTVLDYLNTPEIHAGSGTHVVVTVNKNGTLSADVNPHGNGNGHTTLDADAIKAAIQQALGGSSMDSSDDYNVSTIEVSPNNGGGGNDTSSYTEQNYHPPDGNIKVTITVPSS